MNEVKKDRLAEMFSQLPQDKLSPLFREKMMTDIQAEYSRIQKRNKQWGRIGLGAAILLLLVVGIGTVFYIDWSGFASPDVKMWRAYWPEYSLYTFIFLLATFLLGLDYLFRKQYKKKIGK